MNETAQMLATLSEWIDSSYPETMIGSELHIRRRIDKLMEESGEVGQAVGGWFGENPRKGITHTRTDVLGELLDVAVTALGAYESLTGNTGGSMDALEEKMRGLLKRVDLPTPEARPAEQDTETLPLDPEPCDECNGSGVQGGPPDNYYPCPACGEYSHPDDRTDDRTKGGE